MRSRERRPALAAVLLLHALVALVGLPAVHVAIHSGLGTTAEIHGSTDPLGGGTPHQTGCPGCTLLRAPSAPTAAVARVVVAHVVVVPVPASASDTPTPLRSSPLGGRAPPLV
jgi:hypothetical protein